MLGRHVAAAAERAGIAAVPVRRTCSDEADCHCWDLSKWMSNGDLDRVFSGVDAVVHAGALVYGPDSRDEGALFDINVRSCLNLGLWAIDRRVPLVHVSSAAVYADPEAVSLDENSPLGPNVLSGNYGLSKLLAEDEFFRLRQHGLHVAIIRPSSLYGCGLPSGKLVSHFLATAGQDKVIEIAPPASDRVDFVHAADVASSIVAILRSEAWATFNISSGTPASLEELAESCIAAAGRGHMSVACNTQQTRSPVTRFALVNTRARQILRWKPLVGLTQGLGMMLDGRYSPASETFPHGTKQA
jgi:UDP-glucose 4-epimerase